MHTLAIVILNYNGKKYLEKFLPSVLKHSHGYPVYVADNDSTDDSVDFLHQYYPEIRQIHFPLNHGYAQGYNEALKEVNATYYCLLNSDIEVTEGWLTPLLDLIESNPVIAAVQPKILDYNRQNYFEHAGGVGGFLDVLGYPFTRGRLFDTREEDKGQYNTPPIRCFWASGACMIVRSEAYHQLGGFDGDFFAHMEEIDLCWRFHLAGLEVWASGDSVVYHVGGGTLDYQSPRKTFLNFHNSLAMLYKNLPDNRLAGVIFLRLVLDGVAGIYFLVSGFPKHCWAVARAHFAFYARWAGWRRKRRALAPLRENGSVIPLYGRSILRAYFLQGIKTYSALPPDDSLFS